MLTAPSSRHLAPSSLLRVLRMARHRPARKLGGAAPRSGDQPVSVQVNAYRKPARGPLGYHHAGTGIRTGPTGSGRLLGVGPRSPSSVTLRRGTGQRRVCALFAAGPVSIAVSPPSSCQQSASSASQGAHPASGMGPASRRNPAITKRLEMEVMLKFLLYLAPSIEPQLQKSKDWLWQR